MGNGTKCQYCKRAVEVMKKVVNGEDVKALAQQVMEENTADE